MKILLMVTAVFAAVVLAVLFIPIRIVADYKRDAVNNTAEVYLKYLFFKFRLTGGKKGKKAEKKTKEKEPFSFEGQKRKLTEAVRVFDLVKGDVGKILDYAAERALVFENIETEIEFGFEDAMHTGIFTGILNGFVYSVLGFIHNRSNLKKMNVNIQPMFGKICFDLHVGCILRVKAVHIIVIAFSVLKLLRKLKKEGRD